MAFFLRSLRDSSLLCRATFLAAMLFANGLEAQERTPLSALHAVAEGVDAGALPDSTPLPAITITLKRTAAQQASLDAFLKSVQTVGANGYHAWLTPAAYAAQFAPSTDSVAEVSAWLAGQGLQVSSISAGGMRILASGSAAQANAAFGVSLRRMTAASGDRIAVEGTPSVPVGGLVASVSGLDATASADAVWSLEAAVDANASTVVFADLTASAASADELNEVLEQAAAQGQTAVLTHVGKAVLPARALVLAGSADTAASAAAPSPDARVTPRPDWQVAAGLPWDDLRAVPDAAAANVAEVVAALGTVARKGGLQGEIASRFYAVASEDGVFTHADAAAPPGSWRAADGLGVIDIPRLLRALDTGATPPLSSVIVLSSHNLTHGQAMLLTATITGGSGPPTGTVTFATSQDGTLGSSPLVAGTTAGTAVATYTTSALPGGLHGFYGTYNGDSTYALSTTNVDTATVQPEAVAVNGSVSGSPAVGSTVPVSISVKSPSGFGTPSGTVTVYAYGTALGQAAFTGTLQTQTTGTAVASVPIPATDAGSFSFQANCTTDASFSCYQPATFAVTIAKGTPMFSLVETGTASSASAAVTLLATVTVPAGASSTVVPPTGTVQFLDNGTAIGSGTLDKSGKASYTGPLGSGSTHVVTASYGGDGNYTTATAAANASVKVTPSVALTVVTAGSSLSATVTPPAGTTTAPTGSVQFLLGSTVLGTSPLANDVATYSGAYGGGLLTAVYGGDAAFNTATSNAIDTTKVTPTVTLTKTSTDSSTNTVALSAAVTSTSSKVPTGTVNFLDGVTQIGAGTLNASGVVTFSGALSTTSAKAVRGLSPFITTAHTLTASYLGDTVFNAAVSNAVTANATTTLITTTTALTSSSGYTGTFGTSFTFNVVVTPASYVAAGTSPSGVVTISDATGVVGTGTLNSMGGATIMLSTLSVGTHALTAAYGGDSNYAASTSSPAVTVTIAAVTATVAATVTPAGSVPYGYDANVNVTVTATSGANGPNGTVTATIGGATYTGTLSPTTGSLVSTATISFPVPPPGTYTITVACGSGLTCTNTATAKLTTIKGFTKTTLTVSSTSPQAGVGTMLTATVANTGTGSGTYTYGGTVTFYAGNRVLGTGTVANGTATATVIYTTAVAQSVYAVYSGDANWNGSTSDPVAVTPLPIVPVVTLSANTLNGIVSQNMTLTASVSSGLNTLVLVPSGKVTFFDTYNGIVVNLGSAPLLSNGLNAGYATLSTTGLQSGAHRIAAVYSGDVTFTTVTSSAIVINMGDFNLSFVPAGPVISQGGTGQVTVVVGSLNGFAGMVALGCTPPGGTLTACAVAPASVPAGSSASVTITTTKSTATVERGPSTIVAAVFGLGAVYLLGLRRYRVASVMVVLLAVTMMSGGCTQVAATGDSGGNTGTGGSGNSGTPLGTIGFTITGVAVDAPVAARHQTVVNVTVQ